MKDVKDSFFGGSASRFVQFFVENEELSEAELQKLMDLINK